MNNLIEAAILGIIQGITEFFPVSSSGHLVLMRKLFNFKDQGLEFDAILHFGTLFALLIYFAKDWIKIFSGLFYKDRKNERRLLFYLILGSLPVAIIGYFAASLLEDFFRDIVWVAAFLIITGLIFIAADKFDQIKLRKKELSELKLKDALAIGGAQALALLPGISRSGITISAGIFCKMKRDQAARFSFLLATPAILGASLFSILEITVTKLTAAAGQEYIVGFIFSAIFSLLAIKYFLRYLKKHNLFFFSMYVIILGLFLLVGEFYLF